MRCYFIQYGDCRVHIPNPRGCVLKQKGTLESKPDLIVYFQKLQSAVFDFLIHSISILLIYILFIKIRCVCYFEFFFSFVIKGLLQFLVFFQLKFFVYFECYFIIWFQGSVVPNIYVQILLLCYFCEILV